MISLGEKLRQNIITAQDKDKVQNVQANVNTTKYRKDTTSTATVAQTQKATEIDTIFLETTTLLPKTASVTSPILQNTEDEHRALEPEVPKKKGKIKLRQTTLFPQITMTQKPDGSSAPAHLLNRADPTQSVSGHANEGTIGKKIATKQSTKKTKNVTIPNLEIPDMGNVPEMKEILDKWQARSTAWRNETSVTWQQTQERFLWMIPLSMEQKIEEFQSLIDEMDWTYGTAHQYWSALMKAMTTIGIYVPLEMKVQGRVYKNLKFEEDPKRPTHPMTKQGCLSLIQKLMESGQTMLAQALNLAFTLGQRVGDVLMLEASQMSIVDDTKISTKYLAIVFRRGKTVKRRQPFCRRRRRKVKRNQTNKKRLNATHFPIVPVTKLNLCH